METTPLQPIQQKQRIAIIDILRGWALLGVALMNYVDYFYMGVDFKTYKPDMLFTVLQGFCQIVFAAKSWTMLSFLFGYGFSILIKSVESKGISPVPFFTRRMFWLFVLAIINSALFWGDILKDYAVMGMVLLAFRKCSAKTSFYIAIGLFIAVPGVVALVNSFDVKSGMSLVEPYFPLFESHNPLNVLWFGLIGTYLYEIVSPNYLISVHVVMLGCFFLGMAAQKAAFFVHLQENKKYIKRIFWTTLAVTLSLIAVFIVSQQMKLGWMKYYSPFYWIILSMMLFIMMSLCWLYVSGKLKAFFNSMQVIGKMTLTNYMVQNLLAVLLFSGFGFGLSLKHRLHFGWYMLFALVIYVAQVYFSKWWLARYQYGPIEWAWRQLSYAKRLPIKKQQVEEVPVTIGLQA